MKKVNKFTFSLVLIFAIVIFYISIFGLVSIKGANNIRLGIDIRGGVETIYAPKDLDRTPTATELEAVQAVLESRLDGNNILDREITTDKTNGEILVRFPWKSDEKDFDPKKAIAELGETALLSFKDPDGKIVVEGKNIKGNSSPIYNQESLENQVQIEFDAEGSKKFADATKRLIGKTIAIYLDDKLISEPTVEQAITGGSAVITNIESAEEAKDLSTKINSGALPFSLEAKNFNTISPTLGSGSLNVMISAGILTFILVCLFMILYYKLPGFVACIGLLMQFSLQLLFISIPQITLTLPGIAGIILSLGMGVDTNIIIAERIKEEIRSGKTLGSAIETGYHRAFSAVLDGNLTTAIVAVILIILGSGSILSFGYTLITGVLLNFLTGITASKLMVVSLSKYNKLQNKFLYGKRRVQHD